MPRVLIVDDDESLCRTYGRILRRAGFLVEFAGTIAAAREMLGKLRWDAVLVDIMLPDGSGAELLPEIHHFVSPSQVALVSAYVTADHVIENHREVAAIVPKPMGPDSLVSLVKILTRTDTARLNIESFVAQFHLSRREAELVAIAVEGLDDKLAAVRMKVSHGSIRKFWDRIFKKTGLRSQRDVISGVFRLGLASSTL